MTATIRRLIASLLVVCMAAPPSQGAMLATDAALGAAQRGEINRLLDRADVQARLESYGVKADDVKARVASLTDAEVAELAAKIDSLPAGGNIVGALVLVFVILLITDILGLTKIFPFTRPIR